MPDYTAHQKLLMRLRDERCGGNAAELARKIEKDATYVHRLFYPSGKKGGKGVGLEIMQACTKAFKLPPGYWEGIEELSFTYPTDRDGHSNGPLVATETDVIPYRRSTDVDEWTAEAIRILSKLDSAQKGAAVARLREFVGHLGPPRDGQTLPMAEKNARKA